MIKCFNRKHIPIEKSLIDSSRLTLESRIDNVNQFSSNPVDHADHMKDTYAYMTAEHTCKIYGSLKIIDVLLEMQGEPLNAHYI